MRTIFKILLGAIGGLGLFFASATAVAQEDGEVIQLDESVYEAEPPTPDAFYVLHPADLEYDALDAEPSFVSELEESVEKSPF